MKTNPVKELRYAGIALMVVGLMEITIGLILILK